MERAALKTYGGRRRAAQLAKRRPATPSSSESDSSSDSDSDEDTPVDLEATAESDDLRPEPPRFLPAIRETEKQKAARALKELKEARQARASAHAGSSQASTSTTARTPAAAPSRQRQRVESVEIMPSSSQQASQGSQQQQQARVARRSQPEKISLLSSTDESEDEAPAKKAPGPAARQALRNVTNTTPSPVLVRHKPAPARQYPTAAKHKHKISIDDDDASSSSSVAIVSERPRLPAPAAPAAAGKKRVSVVNLLSDSSTEPPSSDALPLRARMPLGPGGKGKGRRTKVQDSEEDIGGVGAGSGASMRPAATGKAEMLPDERSRQQHKHKPEVEVLVPRGARRMGQLSEDEEDEQEDEATARSSGSASSSQRTARPSSGTKTASPVAAVPLARSPPTLLVPPTSTAAPASTTSIALPRRQARSAAQIIRPELSPLHPPSAISSLLTLTGQERPFVFSSFVGKPPRPFPRGEVKWRKLGEASYSEVFAARRAERSSQDVHSSEQSEQEEQEEVVIKVIPLNAFPSSFGKKRLETLSADWPFLSECKAVEREVGITRLLGGEADGEGVEGFVGFKGAFVVQGSYPTTLLSAWDAFHDVTSLSTSQTQADESSLRPDKLLKETCFVLVCLPNEGSALESFRLRNWGEGLRVWLDVARALAKAEKELGFEHRDLHWGNVLVQRGSIVNNRKDLATTLAGLTLSSSSDSDSDDEDDDSAWPSWMKSEVKATIIDFTFARLAASSRPSKPSGKGKGKTVSPSADAEVTYDPFEDEEIFEGEDDLQFDVYREMRRRTGGDWKGFHPVTNLLWLYYLLDKILHSKKLTPPRAEPIPARLGATTTKPGGGSKSKQFLASSPRKRTATMPVSPRPPTAANSKDVRAYAELCKLEKAFLARGLSAAPSSGKGKAKQAAGKEWQSTVDFVGWYMNTLANQVE